MAETPKNAADMRTAGGGKAAEEARARLVRAGRLLGDLLRESGPGAGRDDAIVLQLHDALDHLESGLQALDAIGEAESGDSAPLDAFAALEARVEAREQEVQRLLTKFDEQLRYRERMNQVLAEKTRELEDARAEIASLHGSFALRIGRLLIDAIRHPRGLLALPKGLLALLRDAWPRVVRRLKRGFAPNSPDCAPDLGPDYVFDEDAAAWASRAAESEAPVKRLLVGTDHAPDLPADLAGLRIATIMDEFSFNAYRHCGDLRQIDARSWRAEVESYAPHALIVESAWKGKDGSWARKVYPLSRELVELVEWCRERRIPTVFWNKEDPVHLSVFMRTARQFDFVFTTDVDCVRAYKSALGHDQVYWLPFGCQPREHNPVEEYQRKDAFCFAGSFYAKYPERQRDFATLVESMSALRPFEIFDRNAGNDDPALAYPGRYAPMIQGALPHDRISLAYKGYRYGININTVKQSQSMFARRVFDLLACNTVTISNFSRGLRMMLGDLVISSDDAGQLTERVAPLIADDETYRRFRLAGLRKVMAGHTYQDRLRYMLEKVGGRTLDSDLPEIMIVARANDGGQAADVLASYARQRYERKGLVLVVPDALASQIESSREAGVRIIPETQAGATTLQEHTRARWVGCFHPDDHYGEHYLTDLALATRYSDAGAIGKAAHYAAAGDGVTVKDLALAYRPGQSIPLRRAIARADLVAATDLRSLSRQAPSLLQPQALGIDEFNYCSDGVNVDPRLVGDAEGLWTGVPQEQLHELAENATAIDLQIAEQSTSPSLSSEALAKILPVGKHAEGAVLLSHKDGALQLQSRLAGNKHTYVYARDPIPVEQLFPEDTAKVNFIVDTEMLVSFVMIFMDADGQRIGHSIRACSSNLSISIPAGTRQVRIGLRVQGPGVAMMRRLVLGHVPSPVAGVPGRAEHLVVARGYPSYANLYSYAYVHRRIKGYAEAGVPADVFRLTEDPIAFGEFEGVDVVSGQLSDLELMIRSNQYRTVMVHSLDRGVCSVLRECPQETRILVWVHGAEIQPWYRRDFSFHDDKDRKGGIQRSNDRMAFWRELFADPPQNMTFVFVSRHLVREAFRDVGIELDPSRYVVIHNHIDGELFAFHPKPAAQRHKLLSIRPYSRPTYANDLTVKAILDLVDEPFFNDLEFRIIGDGRLFDQTTAPLLEFPNVRLEKRFLSQREIAAMHKEYGVFLSPTRIDSQGVSRDEAMASGLVPITNRVSAVPEFVDDECAILVEPEDWRGIADGIRRLHEHPEEFTAMSEAAARRVRRQSGRQTTLAHEIGLIENGRIEVDAARPARMPHRKRVAIYGDLDVNLIDGSAIWAASLAEVVAGNDECDVDLFLKAPVRATQVLKGLLGKINVRLVEPPLGVARIQPAEALDAIQACDVATGYDAVILRGFDLAQAAVRRPALEGRLWVYLTDIPQSAEECSEDQLQALGDVARGARFLLCQTEQLEKHLVAMAPTAAGKTRLLPPMLPDMPPVLPKTRRPDEPLRLAYAGKFAPLWGIRELFGVVATMRAEGLPIELHVFGDKIHNPADDPTFRMFVQSRLDGADGVTWHRGLDRTTVLTRLREMDVGWAWRQPALEEHTLELSTKVLEYAAAGAAPLLARGPVNTDALGADYPLFADAASIATSLRSAIADQGLLELARARAGGLADRYVFSEVRARHVAPLLQESPSDQPGAT